MRPELVGDDRNAVGRKAASAGVFADRVFVVGLVDAVDLVTRDVAGDPAVRHAERLDDVVRLARDRGQFFGAELTGPGDLPFDDVALHMVSLLCVTAAAAICRTPPTFGQRACGHMGKTYPS